MKPFFTFFLLLIGINLSAQRMSLIEEDINVSGSMDQYWETTDIGDVSPADKGARWHLVKKGEIIIFWIDIPPMGLYELSKTQWNTDHNVLAIQKDAKGLVSYYIASSKFMHLCILEYEKGHWLVQLCSRPIQTE